MWATIQGWNDALENPEETGTFVQKYNPCKS